MPRKKPFVLVDTERVDWEWKPNRTTASTSKKFKRDDGSEELNLPKPTFVSIQR